MSDINPAEALLAIIGVRPIISHRIEEITPQEWRNVDNIQSIIRAQAERMVKNELEDRVRDFDPIMYQKTLGELTQPYKASQVEAMLHQLPPFFTPFLDDFMALSRKTFQYLYQHFPIQVRQSVAGPSNVKPAGRLINKFESLLYILDNPIEVFTLMNEGRLLSYQVEGLKAIYPSVYDYMERSIRSALGDEKVQDKKFQLARKIEFGVQMFLGKSSISDSLKKILQTPANIQKPEPNQSSQEKPTTSKLSQETAPKSTKIAQGV